MLKRVLSSEYEAPIPGKETTVQIEVATRPESANETNWYLRIGIVLFALLIALPGVAGLFLTNDIKTLERRKPAPPPKVTLSGRSIRKFPKRTDDYLADRVGFRDQMVMGNGLVRYSLSAPMVRQGIVYGEDDMIFRMSSNIVQQYLGGNRYKSRKALNKSIRKFGQVKRFAESINAKFFMTIAPNKITVYGADMAPSWLEAALPKGATQFQQVEKASKVTLGKSYVSSLQTLRSNRDIAPLYSHYGTHWDELGAFFSYRQVMARVRRDFPDIKILSLDNVVVKRNRTIQDTGNARVMGLTHYLKNNYATVKPRKRKAKILKRVKARNNRSGTERMMHTFDNPSCKGCPRLVVLGDSFSLRWHKMFPESFSQVLFMHHDLGRFDLEEVKAFEPDVVLLEIVEQQLSRKFRAPKF